MSARVSSPRWLQAALGSAMAVLVLAGCAATGRVAPHPPLLDGEALVGPTTARPDAGPSSTSDWPGGRWYSDFGDPALEALIDKALAGTPTLQTADARAERAAAQAGAARANLWPQLSLDASSNRQRLSANGLVPPPYAGTTLTQNNLQLSGRWELDLFGRNRAELDAAIGAARAADADAQAARTQLSTQIARGWFALARLLEQHRTLTAIQSQRRQTVDLVRQRVSSGLDTTVELRQAENQAFEVGRDLAALDEQIGNTRHALAALSGQGPEALASAAPAWREARTLAWPDTVPAVLLGRRADLVAARLRVESSLRDVDAARTLFYPNISLTAFAGFNALGLSDWLSAGSRTYGIGPAITLPVFDAGRLRANLRSRSADADAAIATYNGALVDALREVADQLTTLDSLRVQEQRQVDVQRTADEARQLATARYRAGLGNFLTVLQSQAIDLAQRRVTIDLKYRVIDSQIALVRALGGGYRAPNAQAPTAQAPDAQESGARQRDARAITAAVGPTATRGAFHE